MKIQMLIDVPGPVDGKHLGTFEAGKTYDVDAKVARLTSLYPMQVAA